MRKISRNSIPVFIVPFFFIFFLMSVCKHDWRLSLIPPPPPSRQHERHVRRHHDVRTQEQGRQKTTGKPKQNLI
jgi:hypothetical protein